MPYASALTALTELDLTRLLARLHDESLKCPIGPAQLHASGLSYLVDKTEFLSGLDQRAVRAVLVAVIAERRSAPR